MVVQHGQARYTQDDLNLVCVQMRGAECVIMAGDPQQLPPTVLTVTGLECDLDRTVFDRLQVC